MYCQALGETFDACIAGTPIPSAGKYDLPAALAQNLSAISLQLQTPYLKYFIAMDARPLLGSITCPVMALNGTKDRKPSLRRYWRRWYSGYLNYDR